MNDRLFDLKILVWYSDEQKRMWLTINNVEEDVLVAYSHHLMSNIKMLALWSPYYWSCVI